MPLNICCSGSTGTFIVLKYTTKLALEQLSHYTGVAMKRREVGALGEKIAAEYLTRRGYVIRERNFRSKEGEIDIIAEKDDFLVFIEVRTRTGPSFGTPEESVTAKKKERLIALAQAYREGRKDLPRSWRIDVVALELGPEGEVSRLELIENAISRGLA